MISDNERERFFVSEGDVIPGGETTWYIVDWDQRRTITVTVDEYRFDDELVVEYLDKYIDQLPSDVCAVHISADGDLLKASASPADDRTQWVEYLLPNAFHLPQGVNTVRRSELEEIDRLGANVDLVTEHLAGESRHKKLVFKYYFLAQFWNRLWDELNLWMRLPKHPNIVPFDRVVIDELEGRVLGFTSHYIAGGTLEENKSRIFKLKYLQQLISLVDDLNTKYGISHQDIAPRNLIIDGETDSIILFDFNFSARIGEKVYSKDRDDVKATMFTIYEIITGDDHFRSVPFDQQNLDDIESLGEWVKDADVQIDSPVSEYRSMVTQWAERRRAEPTLAHYREAPEAVDWPPVPDPPLREVPAVYRDENMNFVRSVKMVGRWSFSREAAREKGRVVLNWERPARSKLVNGARVLATGEVAKE